MLRLPHGEISWFVYVVRVPEQVDRNQIQTHSASRGIATGRYFAPIHLQPCWRAQAAAAAGSLGLTNR